MRCVAREMAHLGVRVVTVQPGYIATDILSNLDQKFVEAQNKVADSPTGKLYPGFKRYLDGERMGALFLLIVCQKPLQPRASRSAECPPQ